MIADPDAHVGRQRIVHERIDPTAKSGQPQVIRSIVKGHRPRDVREEIQIGGGARRAYAILAGPVARHVASAAMGQVRRGIQALPAARGLPRRARAGTILA